MLTVELDLLGRAAGVELQHHQVHVGLPRHLLAELVEVVAHLGGIQQLDSCRGYAVIQRAHISFAAGALASCWLASCAAVGAARLARRLAAGLTAACLHGLGPALSRATRLLIAHGAGSSSSSACRNSSASNSSTAPATGQAARLMVVAVLCSRAYSRPHFTHMFCSTILQGQ
jgi:hypothetical protein